MRKAFDETKQATEHCDRINFNLALNYGGRDELRRVMEKICQEVEQGKLRAKEVTEELLAQFLDTANWGDPDLVIRTSGENRVSNFLLWQISYAEFFVTDTLWPDFSAKTLVEALVSYKKGSRRRGS